MLQQTETIDGAVLQQSGVYIIHLKNGEKKSILMGNWWLGNIYQNIIVNNLAGKAGKGISYVFLPSRHLSF